MLLEQRRSAAETTRSAETAALRGSLLPWIEKHRITTICAYVPVQGEPGSPELLDALREAGCRVLLPIVVGSAPLDWAEYSGVDSLRPARFGLLEPSGTRLAPEAIAEADAVLVPALAVDHQGVRLGRGAGHYDRSLPAASSRAALIGVIRDDEFVSELPGEDHDVRMNAVVTPDRGVVELPV
jgi:5-formyltetrahydrofolate cyclo-ligase